jgi:hypothetical protein
MAPALEGAEATFGLCRWGWRTSAPFINPLPRKPFLPIFVRMHPLVWRYLLPLGEFDHMDRRRIPTLSA